MHYADSIEGNEIVSCEIDIQSARLILHTLADIGRVDVCFSGVLAHDFSNVVPEKNVMREIETLDVPQLRALYKDEFPEWLAQGFPAAEQNDSELEKSIRKSKLKIFAVHAQEGMKGIVIAKAMEINHI